MGVIKELVASKGAFGFSSNPDSTAMALAHAHHTNNVMVINSAKGGRSVSSIDESLEFMVTRCCRGIEVRYSTQARFLLVPPKGNSNLTTTAAKQLAEKVLYMRQWSVSVKDFKFQVFDWWWLVVVVVEILRKNEGGLLEGWSLAFVCRTEVTPDRQMTRDHLRRRALEPD
jgi:predicted Rdx family selenoprotein